VDVSKISLLGIDTMAIEQIVKKFSSEESDGQKQAEESEPAKNNLLDNPLIPKSVFVDSIEMAVKPAAYPQLTLDRGDLNISGTSVDLSRLLRQEPDAVEIARLMLRADSNLSVLSLDAGLKGDTITVKSISLRDIDTVAITNVFATDEGNDSNAKEAENSAESTPAKKKETPPNPVIPKWLVVEHMDSSIKSAKYDPVLVKSAEINATNIKFDIPKLTARSGEIDIDAETSFANLMQHGVIKDNQIESRGYIKPLNALFETYEIPVRENAFSDMSLNIDADEKEVSVDIGLDGKEILQAKEGEFNVNRLHLSNHVVYHIEEGTLKVNSEGNISTPYAKDIRLQNLLTFEQGELKYNGEIVPGTLEGIDANYTKPLNDLKITYDGNISSVTALIDSEGLKGKFVSPDFKKADFNLSTRNAIVLKDMVSLPEPLQAAKVSASVNVPLDFAHITPLKAKAVIVSNIANIDAVVDYNETVNLSARTVFPKDSLLRDFSKELNLDAFNPLQTNVSMVKNLLNVDVKSNGLTSRVNYGLDDKNITGDLVLGGAKFLFRGNIDKEVFLENSVGSLQSLMKKIDTIFAFEAPPLDGDLKLSLKLKNMKDLELLLNSKILTYQVDRERELILNDNMISLGFSDSVLKINKYHTTFQKQKIFATKPSIISIKDGKIEISPFWVNDDLKVTGNYAMDDKKGEILAYDKSLSLNSEVIDLKSKIDIKMKIEGVKTNINGTVTIVGGNLHYDMDKKSFPSDSDVIIVQDMKKKEASPFMDNLSVMIKVNTAKPILYKTADADIRAKADIMIEKAPKGPIYVLGTSEILKGSSYTFQNKKFVFKKSIIAFTGDPEKPILDIAAVYNSINYDITIQVTGSPATPNIIFSSLPRLSREQILSVILFDSQEAAGSNSGEDMMKMMGGAMAKSALSNVGIKIDYLSLGADGTAEIGKKLTDKVTIIYVEDKVSGAKLQYDYSRHIKGVLTTNSESSGADIIYRREF